MNHDLLTDACAPVRPWPVRPWALRRSRQISGSRPYRDGCWHRTRRDRLPVAGRGYDPELLVGRVVTYLNEHLTDPNLDLDQLADAAQVSPSSLGRAFRDVLNLTPWHYVMRRRIERSKRLLTDTDRSLAEIALDTGFYDQAHFSRTFKRFTGTTPGIFREENRDIKTDELSPISEEREAC